MPPSAVPASGNEITREQIPQVEVAVGDDQTALVFRVLAEPGEADRDKLQQFGLFEVLDLPFAGSALEVIWGLLPAWLGFEKWFSNGFHRVRKQFSTYQREDYPPEMAGYINRYHRGRLVVGWHDDCLTLKAWRPDLGDLRHVLRLRAPLAVPDRHRPRRRDAARPDAAPRASPPVDAGPRADGRHLHAHGLRDRRRT